MGVAALGQCWPTAQAAAQAVCAHAYPLSEGLSLVVCSGASAGGVLSLQHRTESAWTPSFVAYAGLPCEVMDFAAAPFFVSPADAALMAGAVVGVFGAGFAWRAIRNALSDRDLG